MALIIRMSDQINPWSIYDYHFRGSLQTKLTKVAKKSLGKSIQTTDKTQHTKKIQNKQKAQKTLKTLNRQQGITESKLRYIPISLNKIQPRFCNSVRLRQKCTSNCNLCNQETQVNKLLEQNLILKFMKLELLKSTQILPRIKVKRVKRILTIGTTQRIHSKADYYREQSLRLQRQQSKNGYAIEKVSTINLKPFDESNMLKRAKQLMMKRKKIDKKVQI